MTNLGNVNSQGEVQFVGAVTTKNCGVIIDSSGVVMLLIEMSQIHRKKVINILRNF